MTFTTTPAEHVAHVRSQVERAREQLREVCADRDTAILVAYRLRAVQHHESRLERVEAALADNQSGDVLADAEIPF
jgi:hypothetical protein